MSSVLCTVTTAKVHLRISATATGDDALITTLVDATEAALLSACGRKDRPFATAATGVTEVHDGTQTRQIMVNYPISAITSITIGRDASNPVETLSATNVDVVVFATGKRAIYRTDGGLWNTMSRDLRSAELPPVHEPRIVTIVYNRDADLPDLPKLAIHRAVANVYRQIGSEDAKSETLADGYSRSLAAATDDPIWQLAVKDQWEPSIS